MAKPDVIYEVHESDTSYRFSPNPDAPPGFGFRHGGVLEWRDSPNGWDGSFFIAPNAIDALAQAFAAAAKDVEEG